MSVQARPAFPASFAFATFPGKKKSMVAGAVQRQPTIWSHFLGLIICTLNEPMWTAIIDAIDGGEGEGLDSDIAELVELMEELRDGNPDTHEQGSQIAGEKFLLSAMETSEIQTVYSIQMTADGLSLLQKAVATGMKHYRGKWGQSLEVFALYSEGLLNKRSESKPSVEEEDEEVPKGYTGIRRRKRRAG